jgi:hypothetical protein
MIVKITSHFPGHPNSTAQWITWPKRHCGICRSHYLHHSRLSLSNLYVSFQALPVCLWIHHQLAQERFQNLKILSNQEFDYVDWELVYEKLRDVPRLFQLWLCKQVMGVAGTMEWDKTAVRSCPSCMVARDTCIHVLFCSHKGRVETFKHTLDLMEEWLEDAETDPNLLDCIAEYAHG